MCDSNNYKNMPNNFTDVDAILSELSSKYLTKARTSLDNDLKPDVHKSKLTKVTISDSEDESDTKDLLNKYLNVTTGSSKISNYVYVSDSEDEIDKTQVKKRSPKLSVLTMTKEDKAASKKAIQEEKRTQRELKKAENLEAKVMKKKLNQVSKKLKPEEYLKQVEVVVCDSLSEKALSKEIFKLFNENDIVSKQSQMYANTITWKRKSQSHFIDGQQLISSTNTDDCEFILFILECDELLTMIAKDELIEYFKTAQDIMPGKIITLGLFGVNEYFRLSKNQRKRNFKNSISEKSNSTNKDFDTIDRNVIEINLTKLQVLLSICHKYLDTAHDVAALVNHMTKAIAQTPYKLKKNEQMEQAENYMIGDNKDCVLVDKNGNGLSRLWQQNITAFPLARLDLAESVMATYPTFNSLMQVYESCADDTAGEKLLENLEIRRAAGPLTNFRKVGPEFSKKMFRYYNSRNPDMVL